MADLIAYTDLQTYLKAENTSAAFSADQITVATYCCTAASDLVKDAAGRTFEIQGSTANRTFTFKRIYGTSYGGDYYGVIDWGVVYPSLLAAYGAPQLEVDDYFLTGQTIGSITVTDYITAATYTPTRGWPYNASAAGEPYTRLEFAAGTYLPSGDGQLVVNAKWGYVTSIPAGLKAACLMQASRFFKRSAAPFGVAGADAMGNAMRLQPRLDPDVEVVVSTYRRWWSAVA